MNRKEEIEARLAAIRTELEAPDADIEGDCPAAGALKAGACRHLAAG